MPRYIVLSKFDEASLKSLRDHPDLNDLRRQVEGLGGKVVEQHYLLGKYDVMSVVDLHEGEAAQLLRLSERTTRTIVPAINQDLFVRLLGRSAENTGPHRWQVAPWARVIRRCFRGSPRMYRSRHIQQTRRRRCRHPATSSRCCRRR